MLCPTAFPAHLKPSLHLPVPREALGVTSATQSPTHARRSASRRVQVARRGHNFRVLSARTGGRRMVDDPRLNGARRHAQPRDNRPGERLGALQAHAQRLSMRLRRVVGGRGRASLIMGRDRPEAAPPFWGARVRRRCGGFRGRPPAEGAAACAACRCCGLMAASRGLGEAAPAREKRLLLPAPARGLAQAGWLGRGDHRQGAPGAAGRRAVARETRLFSCVLPYRR